MTIQNSYGKSIKQHKLNKEASEFDNILQAQLTEVRRLKKKISLWRFRDRIKLIRVERGILRDLKKFHDALDKANVL